MRGLSGSSASTVMLFGDPIPLSRLGEPVQLGSDAPLYLFAAKFAAARPKGARFSLEPDVPRGGKADAEADVVFIW